MIEQDFTQQYPENPVDLMESEVLGLLKKSRRMGAMKIYGELYILCILSFSPQVHFPKCAW